MGAVDLVVLGFILLFAIKGTINGLISEAISILGIILAVLFSYMLYEPLFKFMQALGLGEQGAAVGAYILGFLIVYVIVLLLGRLVQKTLQMIHLGWVNKILGFTFGLFKGAFIASVILWIVVSIIPSSAKLSFDIRNSLAAQATMKVLPYCYDRLNAISNFDRLNPFK